jgi:DNA replication protein DnaC
MEKTTKKNTRINREKPAEKHCDYCDRSGIVYTSGFEELGTVPLSPCPKCVDPKCTCDRKEPYFYYDNGEIKDCYCRETRIRIDRINRIYTRSGIDKKYRWKRFNDFEAVSKLTNEAKNTAYDIVRSFPHVKKGLFLWGNPGTGKTLLSSIVLTELIIRYAVEGRFISISRSFFNRLKATFVEGSRTYGKSSEIEKELEEADILVVDDFGVQRDSEWEQETLYNLVDARYEAEKFTIFTSNGNPKTSFKELSQGRILSRIKEMSRIMEMTGKDYRENL